MAPATALAATAPALLPALTTTQRRSTSLAEAAARVVADWPPLTAQQVDSLSALFARGGAR